MSFATTNLLKRIALTFWSCSLLPVSLFAYFSEESGHQMFKRGRKQKKSIGSTPDTPFQIDKFCDILLSILVSFPDSNLKSWSLKKEWAEFTKSYFEITRLTERNVRGSYDFFKRNGREVTSLLQSKRSGGFSKGDRMPHLIFPNLKTMDASELLRLFS